MNCKKHILKCLFFILGITLTNMTAQDTPFNCTYDAYLFQYNDIYAVDLASGNSYLAASNVTEGNINAAAYNLTDGFIWGSVTSPSKTIIRIGNDFETTAFYVDELPTNNRYIGGINANGVYYLKGSGTTYYKIDVNPTSASYTQHLGTENLSININIHDWAFNAVDGKLYTVERNSNTLYRIDPVSSMVQNLGEVPILSGLNYTYGAVYFDNTGRFYVSANQTGTVYVIQSVQDLDGTNAINANLFAFGPSSASNDGARCSTAPVPQEICNNGIDDDSDGLVDCEDPSCSGFGNCEVIQAPVSGGDGGGLESNNRLSNKINKRNYHRVKSGYVFNTKTAKRVAKTNRYGQRNTNLQLQDFIPLGVIEEDEVIESTPVDLLDITNATDVYAVDYLKEHVPIASILSLKTENGVYEHTKYICDRLLGAELLSVSTIEINEQTFIKSIIKNIDGTVEFVLSLSAKTINNDTEFAIESHWNLDQYEEDVTFYNFQIWSNSIDDLYKLGAEIVQLLDVQKPVTAYYNSAPPTVFVKKGNYTNGVLQLQIMNTNDTESVQFDAGIRATETSAIAYVNATIALEDYITNVQLETGRLFDIGFRIGDGITTPDDLFLSDGPWGVDDSPMTTVITSYVVNVNTNDFDTADFPVERNISLQATTSDYVAVYRALTPRFQAVDITNYNALKLYANGTGNLEVTFVKQSITNWEAQYKTTITLTGDFQEYVIPFAQLSSVNGNNPDLNDVVTIVFTMVAENGEHTSKQMNLQDVRFTNVDTLSTTTFEEEIVEIAAIPNPMDTYTTINFNASVTENVTLTVYDQLGKAITTLDHNTLIGNNTITLQNNNFKTGIYFCKIINSTAYYNTIKLLVR